MTRSGFLGPELAGKGRRIERNAKSTERYDELLAKHAATRHATILVKTLDGQTFTLEVLPSDTINDAKQKVESMSEIPAHEQRLIFVGRELDDGSTFSDLGSQRGMSLDQCTFHLVRPKKPPTGDLVCPQKPSTAVCPQKPPTGDLATIFVKTRDGQTFTLEVLPSDTINDAKQKVESMSEIPADEQRLIFAGQLVDDGSTFSDLTSQFSQHSLNTFHQCTFHLIRQKPNGDLPLHKAARMGQLFEFKQLLLSGEDANAVNAQGDTPLHVAAFCNHADFCRILVQTWGADANAINRGGHTTNSTALHAAAGRGWIEVCQALVEDCGAELHHADDKVQMTALHRAAQGGHAEVCRLFVQAGAVVDARDAEERTPLHLAAGCAHYGACRVLLVFGADVNAGFQRSIGSGHTYTPLDIAAQYTTEGGYTTERTDTEAAETCQLLIESGADVFMSQNQLMPLHFAASRGNEKVCKILVHAMESMQIRPELPAIDIYPLDESPIDIASEGGHASLAKHLQSGGVHYLPCTAPDLQRVLVWNDTEEHEEAAMLDEMQTQWLAVVGEGRAHAMLGLTLRGMCRGNFPTEVLVRILGFSEQRKRFRTPDKGPSWWVGSTNNFLLSCVSQHRVGGGEISSTSSSVSARSSSTTIANAREGDGHDAARLKLDSAATPRLGPVSHALALGVTPPIPFEGLGLEANKRLQEATAQLRAAAETMEGGCPWLAAYCKFVQQRLSA
jgi:ankyrin repeat protein